MSITFNDLLTDPKYREMEYDELWEICKSNQVSGETLSRIREEFDPLREEWRCSKVLFNHLQKLKAESEKKAEDIKVIDRYPMCKDQPAQIDCVRKDCIYNQEGGKCTNISPAISLNDKATFVCWSEKSRGNVGAIEGLGQKIRSASTCIAVPDSTPSIKDYEKVFDMFFKPINKPVTFTPTEHPITITDQKAREIIISKELLNPNYTDQARKEIIAKLNDCNPNEIKII